MDVQGLVESKEYLFRVAASNANGDGEFIESPSPIIAKMPFGINLSLYLTVFSFSYTILT